MKVNLHNAEFVKSASSIEGAIRDGLPKIVLAGRSNAGKSSTINALLGRKSLARVSDRPGKTIHINYYSVDRKLYLVDLPGYGFSKASKTQKRDWGKLMDEFFGEASDIALCVLIVDARHDPSPEDRMMCNYLKENGIPFMVAANKADTLKKADVDRRTHEISRSLELAGDIPLMLYSARTKSGIDRLRGIIFGLASENAAD